MVVPMPIASPSTAAISGLVLLASAYRNWVAVVSRGMLPWAMPAFMKSSRSLPAVKMPFEPVITRQRIELSS